MNTYTFPVHTREGISHIYIPCANSPCSTEPRESATPLLPAPAALPRNPAREEPPGPPRLGVPRTDHACARPQRDRGSTRVVPDNSAAHTAPVSLLRSRARRTARLRCVSRSACCAAAPAAVGRTSINPPRMGVYAYGFSGPGCGTGGSGSVLACEGCASPPAVGSPSLGSRRPVGRLMPMSSQNPLSHPSPATRDVCVLRSNTWQSRGWRGCERGC